MVDVIDIYINIIVPFLLFLFQFDVIRYNNLMREQITKVSVKMSG